MKRRTSKGKCSFCNEVFGKRAMEKHLEACERRKPTEARPEGAIPRKRKMFHLVVEGRYQPEYWMHLEAPAEATLRALDRFLRRTWLECCGHMSAFGIGGEDYVSGGEKELGEKGMGASLSKVLPGVTEFHHEYDFGTTTHLRLRVLSAGEAETKGNSIRILARNEPPSISCDSCGKAATWVCAQCFYEDKGWLCDECAGEHECGEEMLLPVVNSPRVGRCGYTG